MSDDQVAAPEPESTAIAAVEEKRDSYTIELDGEPMIWRRMSGAEASKATGFDLRTEHYVSDRDRPNFIPPTYVGNPIPSNNYCRGWNGKEGRMKYCRAVAGAGTEVSVGRCKFHGGGSNVTHGLRSRFRTKTPSLQQHIELMQNDPKLLEMEGSVVIISALLAEALETDPIDRAVIERLASELNRMQERVHNLRAKAAYSVEEMTRYWQKLVRVIEAVLADEPELRNKLLQNLAQVGP